MQEQLNPKEAMVLSAFYRPRESNDVAGWSLWNDGPGGRGDIELLVSSLVDRGLLRDPTIEERLDRWKVSELRDALKARGGKTSGNKGELVSRLVESLPEDALDELTSQPKLLIVSSIGLAALAKAQDEDEAKYQEARTRSLQALREGDLVLAARELDKFVSGRVVLNRHLPFGYRRVPLRSDYELLEGVVTADPPSLHHLKDEQRDLLRNSVILETLWGEDPLDNLPADFPSEPISKLAATRHITTAAELTKSRGRSRGITDAVRLEHWERRIPLCGECNDLEGTRYDRGEPIPILPAKGCLSEHGCPLRCRFAFLDRSSSPPVLEVDLVSGESTVRSSDE